MYDIITEISFKWKVFNKGWFCIRVHCSINVCFTLLTTGWYVVTKGKILSLAFGLEAKITPERDPFMIASCSQALFEFHRTLAKCCFWRVSSNQSHCFVFKLMKAFLTTGGWHELKCEYRKASIVITKISQRIQNEKKEKDFSQTAESYDSSKILCLCKHKTNFKLKALVITIHENKAKMSCHAPLMRKAIAPWNWNTQEFCLNWNHLRKRWLNPEFEFKCYNNYNN